MSKEIKYKKLSRIVLCCLFSATIVAGILVSRLEFDFDFEKFFPIDDPQSSFYKEYRSYFESDNDFIIIGLENNGGIFEQDFLQMLDQLTERLSELDNVNQVFSLSNGKDFKKAPGSATIYEVPLVSIDKPERFAKDSIRISKSEDWRGTIVSHDMTSTAIWIKHKELLSKDGCDTLATQVEETVADFAFDNVHLMGRSIGQKMYIELMRNEMTLFMGLSFILVMIFLVIAFRSTWGVWVPIVVVSLTIIWNLAAIEILGHKIDSMLSVLPTIILVVAMSDIVHIITRYLAELRLGTNKIDSIVISLKEVGLATMITSLTTALGFLTLVSSPVSPIGNFGVYAAIGVILAYILAFTLLPAILLLAHNPKVHKLQKQDFWKTRLHTSFQWMMRHKKSIVVSAVILCIVSLVGINKIVSNNYLLQGLNEEHKLKKEMRYFEKEFSGARPLEVAIVYDDDTDPLSVESMTALRDLENYLAEEYGVSAITSFHKLLKRADDLLSSNAKKFESS